jgi:prefoldin subunit 5
MFLKSTRGRVMEHLDKSMDDQKKKETETSQKLEYLERRMKSQQQNIEELHSTQAAAE